VKLYYQDHSYFLATIENDQNLSSKVNGAKQSLKMKIVLILTPLLAVLLEDTIFSYGSALDSWLVKNF